MAYDPVTSSAAALTRSLGAHSVDRPLLGPAVVWNELAEGRLLITQHGNDETSTWLRLQPRPCARPAPFTRAQARATQQLLSGCPQKVLAADLELSPSMVSTNASNVLRGLGLDCCLTRAPLALAVLAAANAAAPPRAVRGYTVNSGLERGVFEVRMTRPEIILRPLLTRAEYDTLRCIVVGLPYAQAAAVRRRSSRTVANQLRSMADKLGVTGRFQIIVLALRCPDDTASVQPTRALGTISSPGSVSRSTSGMSRPFHGIRAPARAAPS